MSGDHVETISDEAPAEFVESKRTKRSKAPIKRSEVRNTPLPSSVAQTFSIFKLQMRIFSKSRSTYMLLFLALLIPILAFSGVAETIIESDLFGVHVSTSYLLGLLPLMIILIPAMVSGRTLSSEFRNRTVYMTFPLPVTRTTFFVGKFLASFVLSWGIIMLAFGFAIIAGDMLYDPSYPMDLVGALTICTFGVFAMTATAFGLGPFFKRGSMGATMGLMLFLPFIIVMVTAMVEVTEGTMEILRTIPAFTSYQTLFLLDHGFGGMFGDLIKMMIGESSGVNMSSIIAVLWGIAFLLLGWTKVVRREL